MGRPSAYTIDGERVPSVTDVLKIAGLTDFSRVPEDALETARERGQDVHAWLELHDQDPRLVPGDLDVQGYLEAWKKFKAERKFSIKAIEEPVLNSAYRYGGTPDRIGRIGQLQVVVEIKVVAKIHPATRLQLMGYALCLDKQAERIAVQLREDGTYRPHAYRDWGEDRADFLSAARVAQFQLRHGLAELREAA